MDKKIVETLKEFKIALGTIGIRVERVILFGSYATGNSREGSDIDVVIISENFNGMNLLERLEAIGLALAKGRIMEPIEAVGYTMKEFNSKEQGTFVSDEIKTKGIEIT